MGAGLEAQTKAMAATMQSSASGRHDPSGQRQEGHVGGSSKIRPLPMDPPSAVTCDRNWKVRVAKESKVLGLPMLCSPRDLSQEFNRPRRPVSAGRADRLPPKRRVALRRFHSTDDGPPKMAHYKALMPPAGLRPMLSKKAEQEFSEGQQDLVPAALMGLSTQPAGALSPRDQRPYACGGAEPRLSSRPEHRKHEGATPGQYSKPMALRPPLTTMRTTCAATSSKQYGSWSPRATATDGVVLRHAPGQGNKVTNAEMRFFAGASDNV